MVEVKARPRLLPFLAPGPQDFHADFLARPTRESAVRTLSRSLLDRANFTGLVLGCIEMNFV